MLSCLGHYTIDGGDAQQDGIDAGGSGNHGSNKSFVPWDVDEGSRAVVVELEPGKTEGDGDAAVLFFGEGVEVDSSEDANHGGLTMIDMAGGADDQVGSLHLGRPSFRQSTEDVLEVGSFR